MKYYIIILFLSVCLCYTSQAQQLGWVDYRDKIPDFPGDTVMIGDYAAVANFSDVFFIDDNEGWITTMNGAEFNAVILHTIDGGETWEIQTPPSKCWTIWMLDKYTGYAGSADGRIYKTTDGGSNWLLHSRPLGYVMDIAFPPGEDIGYAVVENSSFMFRIKPDTLERIQLNGPNFWTSVSCPAVNEVWFVGGASVLFYDGATLEYSSGSMGGYNNCILFENSSLGWITSDAGAGGYYAPKDSWVQFIAFETFDSGWDMCNIGEDHLWIVGFNGLLMNTHNAKDFKRLDDGHAEVNLVWEIPEHPLGNTTLLSVHASSVNNVFVVGQKKAIMKYTEISSIENEVESLKFEVFPNPAKNKFKVKSLRLRVEEAWIEIFDQNGRKLFKQLIPKGTTTAEINVSDLMNGVYFCKLTTANSLTTKKLIIQK